MLLWLNVEARTPWKIHVFICVQSTSKIFIIALLRPGNSWKCCIKRVCNGLICMPLFLKYGSLILWYYNHLNA